MGCRTVSRAVRDSWLGNMLWLVLLGADGKSGGNDVMVYHRAVWEMEVIFSNL